MKASDERMPQPNGKSAGSTTDKELGDAVASGRCGRQVAGLDAQLIRLADTPVRSPDVHARIDPFIPHAYRAESLSRKALAVLTNTKGVTCVLNGMRRRNYVDDSLGALRSPPFDVDLHLYEAFNKM